MFFFAPPKKNEKRRPLADIQPTQGIQLFGAVVQSKL